MMIQSINILKMSIFLTGYGGKRTRLTPNKILYVQGLSNKNRGDIV